MNPLSNSDANLYRAIRELITKGRKRSVQAINQALVYTYFEIGKHIITHKENSLKKGNYQPQTLRQLSTLLTKEFGKGFSKSNLCLMKKFYLAYQHRVVQTVFGQKNTISIDPPFLVSWSHYLRLMRIENQQERQFYEVESINNNWSLRELNRQFDSALYQRLLLSTDVNTVKSLAKQGQILEKPSDAIKDPYILEFLDLAEKANYTESQLEQAIIDKLEHFLLELGKGFLFEARQKRITFSDKHFYIDLVFYNRILQCFLLIDLKIGDLKHQDLGQMQMYVNYYDREMKLEHEKPTIGLVLCRSKNEMVVEYTLPKDNQQIFASRYDMILPDKKALEELLR